MIDQASRWLFDTIQQFATADSLWFADENCLSLVTSDATFSVSPRIISNRFDVAQGAIKKGLPVSFNDFDSSALTSQSVDFIFYRISKEKPVVHHVINEAARLLKDSGQLFLCGEKNEGIKTFIDKAARFFNDSVSAKKQGSLYHAALTRQNTINQELALDDQHYSQLRQVSAANDFTWLSKPGVFGWNKIDEGSAMLAQQALNLLKSRDTAEETLLDLGCGYGYLTLATATFPFRTRTLTDNNAAALLAAQANCINLCADIIPGDAGDALKPSFDVILCNPPFHQGFDADGDLTDKFLASAHRLLSKKGVALFVVNQFIPLERKAASHFASIISIEKRNGFHIIALASPR